MRNLWIAAALVPTALFSPQAEAGDADALASDPFAEAREAVSYTHLTLPTKLEV
ncbi:MAG: hypothetical protein KUG77_27165 [Nannocystaceae bacterium]|nr:hypothetical protein [Nannocystaceae bacterium]